MKQHTIGREFSLEGKGLHTGMQITLHAKPAEAGVLPSEYRAAPPTEYKEAEKDIKIPSYDSNADDALKLVENKYMFLREIHFLDYMFLLSKFSMETATVDDNFGNMPTTYSYKDPFFTEELNEDAFQVFIENKIIKHKVLYEKLTQDDEKCSKFKDIMLRIYKKLNDKLKKASETFSFKKFHALTLGLVYCKGDNISKIKFLFNLFANESKFGKSPEFTEFQEALYLICSYVSIAVRVDLAELYRQEFPPISTEDLKKLLDPCQHKDCKNLVQVIDNRIFGEDGSKSYFIEEFKILFNTTNTI